MVTDVTPDIRGPIDDEMGFGCEDDVERALSWG
jgi:hypothetical protein